MSIMNLLYAFKLENEKYFLYPSSNEGTIDDIKTECRILYEFVRLNPIINLIESVPINDEMEIDKHVKTFMRYNGIENVRGGSYSDGVLHNTTVQFIEKELSLNYETYSRQSSLLQKIRGKYKTNPLPSINELTTEKQKFLELAKRYNKLNSINPCFIQEIEWLTSKIINGELVQEQNEKGRYKTMIEDIKEVYSMFTSIMNEPNTTYLDCVKYEPRIYLYQPNIALDWLIGNAHIQERCMNESLRLLAHVEYMTYFISNIKDDVEFSLHNYPPNYLKTLEITLQLCDIEEN